MFASFPKAERAPPALFTELQMPEFYDKLLLDIIKCQLFGGAAPKLSAEDVSEIIKEAKKHEDKKWNKKKK